MSGLLWAATSGLAPSCAPTLPSALTSSVAEVHQSESREQGLRAGRPVSACCLLFCLPKAGWSSTGKEKCRAACATEPSFLEVCSRH